MVARIKTIFRLAILFFNFYRIRSFRPALFLPNFFSSRIIEPCFSKYLLSFIFFRLLHTLWCECPQTIDLHRLNSGKVRPLYRGTRARLGLGTLGMSHHESVRGSRLGSALLKFRPRLGIRFDLAQDSSRGSELDSARFCMVLGAWHGSMDEKNNKRKNAWMKKSTEKNAWTNRGGYRNSPRGGRPPPDNRLVLECYSIVHFEW